MATKHIFNLPEVASLNDSDVLVIDSGTRNAKIKWSALKLLLKTVNQFTVDNEHGTITITAADGDVFTVTPHDPTKQDSLTFDDTPTEGSLNPVTSDGISQAIEGTSNGAVKYTEQEATPEEQAQARTNIGAASTSDISGKADAQDVRNLEDDVRDLKKDKLDKTDYKAFTGATDNAAGAAGIVPAPSAKGKYLDSSGIWQTPDATPTANSNKLVTSGATKAALDNKQNSLTFDTTPTTGSANPVTSNGVKAALDANAADHLHCWVTGDAICIGDDAHYQAHLQSNNQG